MPHGKFTLEQKRKWNKRYREKHKAEIANRELPNQKAKRNLAKALGICYKCYKEETLGAHAYCGKCLDKQARHDARYRAKKAGYIIVKVDTD